MNEGNIEIQELIPDSSGNEAVSIAEQIRL